jgi:hypothetical protein
VAQHNTLILEDRKEDHHLLVEGGHTFFITDAIWLMEQRLPLHDEFSDSPVDQVRRGLASSRC